MKSIPGRRAFLAGAATLAGAAWLPIGNRSDTQEGKTRLILLGTCGGPRPRKTSSAPAQVIVAHDAAYVVDCGNGVAHQLVFAGVPLTTIRHVFVTHHHSDHNADYGNLIWLAWTAGLRTPVDAWGPPPDEGRVPLTPLVQVHELSQGGLVMQDGRVKVTAALVDHPPVVPAFAYRFDAHDRSIVISGDTARSDTLVKLAQGADVLVHEALYLPAVDRLVSRVANAATLKKHLIDSHTAVADCGRVAAAAGVKTLVLSHLVPSDDPELTDPMWIDATRTHFRGTVIVGKDLLEI